MSVWMKVFLLSLGGALGVNARYWLGVWIGSWSAPPFPWSTFLINVSGSLLIGVASALLLHRVGGEPMRLLIVVGLLGGYTTFSSYTLEGLELIEQGRGALAAIYLGGSVSAGLAGGVVGLALGRSLAGWL